MRTGHQRTHKKELTSKSADGVTFSSASTAAASADPPLVFSATNAQKSNPDHHEQTGTGPPARGLKGHHMTFTPVKITVSFLKSSLTGLVAFVSSETSREGARA